jgi:hypothetical protein
VDEDLLIRRKLTLRAHGKQIVLIKKARESTTHVLMKAFLWALYLPYYPGLSVEIRIRNRFRPDVVALNEHGDPVFWGEAGYFSARKVHSLVRRCRLTHLAMAKWDTRLRPFITIVEDALDGVRRSGPVDLINFGPDSLERFIDPDGEIHISHRDIEWLRLPG